MSETLALALVIGTSVVPATFLVLLVWAISSWTRRPSAPPGGGGGPGQRRAPRPPGPHGGPDRRLDRRAGVRRRRRRARA